MLNFLDLSDNDCFFFDNGRIMAVFFDNGRNGDLYSIIKTFKHILVIRIYITSYINGHKYKIGGYCLKYMY